MQEEVDRLTEQAMAKLEASLHAKPAVFKQEAQIIKLELFHDVRAVLDKMKEAQP